MIKKKHIKQVPKSIRIGHRMFDLIVRSELDDVKLSDCWGYTRTEYDHIVISENQSIHNFKGTLIHEVLHAIRVCRENKYVDDVYKPKKGLDSTHYEHFFIDLFSDGLVGIIQDNPDLVAFLAISE